MKMELLAPAGDMDKLKMAFRYGADAVYLGGKAFGLRAYSGNFSKEEMKEAVDFAHSIGKKVYVTVNIIPHNQDLKGLPDYLRYLESIAVDAVLISDLGVFQMAKEIAPNLTLHVSTQASTTNYMAVKAWKDMGAARVVMAREVSVKDIKEIHEKVDIELEGFVHGAMCISYSGRCLLSNYFTKTRDANRGQCTQACRWKYSLVEENRPGEYYPVTQDERGTYIFNSKDLCLLPFLPMLYDSGLCSLKIEGRMKSVHYVATVVKVYREAMDAYEKDPEHWKVKKEWVEELEKISHRPYTEGFSVKKTDENSQVYSHSSNTQTHDFIGLAERYDETAHILYLEQRNNFKVGDEVEFLQPKGALVRHTIEKMVDEEGYEITVAPHPQQKVGIYIDTPIEPFAMMRRKVKA